MTAKVKWTQEVYGSSSEATREIQVIAYHPECTPQDGFVMEIDECLKARKREPIFCNSCRKLIGYYDTDMELPDYFKLGELVFQALNASVENGYEEVLTTDATLVAVDLVNEDAEIEAMAGLSNAAPGVLPKSTFLKQVEQWVQQWQDLPLSLR